MPRFAKAAEMGETDNTYNVQDSTRLYINPKVTIPLSELAFRFSRASAPGGQHVNRRETRVELLFDVANSPSLTPTQRQRLMNRMPGLVHESGILRIAVETHRSQLRNREEAIRRFLEAMRRGLQVPKKRRPTRPSLAARERRLRRKRRRSLIKRWRRSRPEE